MKVHRQLGCLNHEPTSSDPNLFPVSPSALIFAFDIGTSSLRTALFDTRGRRLEKTTSHETYSLRVSHDGTAELAVRDLEQAALRAVRATLQIQKRSRSLQQRPIVAVGASCFWHSLLGYNSKSKQPTPIYTWADARCREEAQKLRAEMNEKEYHAQTGCMLRTPYWPAKLRWLARIHAAQGITHWMSPAEWLYGRLCGASSVSISMASGTGLMNLHANDWDPKLVRFAGIDPAALGVISDQPVRIVEKAPILPPLHRFPELAQAAWYPALGDGTASNLGSDAVAPKIAAMNIGTSAALRLVTPALPRRLTPQLFCYRVDKERALLGGAISNAGNLRAWALLQLRLPDRPAAIEKALAGRNTPQHGLVVLPFWTGERSPSWPSDIGGTLTGVTYATTALDLLQALIESTYHRLAQIADLLEHQSGPRLDIIVSGGVSHSAESMQRLANVMGRAVRPCAEPEASLRGAAVHVLQQLGHKIERLPRKPFFRPDRTSARLYAQARLVQIALEKRMAGFLSTDHHPATRSKSRRIIQ